MVDSDSQSPVEESGNEVVSKFETEFQLACTTESATLVMLQDENFKSDLFFVVHLSSIDHGFKSQHVICRILRVID